MAGRFAASGLVVLIAVLAPLGGAFLLPLLGRISSRVRNLCALGLILVSLGCSLALVPGALKGTSVRLIVPGFLGISFSLSADALAVFMAIVPSLTGAVIILLARSAAP